MTESEADLALDRAQAARAKTRKRTITLIIRDHSKIYKRGFVQKRSVAVMAHAIKTESGCTHKLNTIEKALRGLPEYKKQGQKSKRQSAGRGTAGLNHKNKPKTASNLDQGPTVAQSDTGIARYQSDARNLNRDGWN